ncbi:MAG: hypothetical protein ACNYPE_08695 [Candidatus Azotimanducaceae bacterium WSBS_2022_MAG_OTU7]
MGILLAPVVIFSTPSSVNLVEDQESIKVFGEMNYDITTLSFHAEALYHDMDMPESGRRHRHILLRRYLVPDRLLRLIRV